MRNAWIALLLPAFAAGPAFAQAKAPDKAGAKPAAGPAGTLEVTNELDQASNNYTMVVTGKADLPDGAIMRILCERVEKSKRIDGSGWQQYAEVKAGAFDTRWICNRAQFVPGTYVIEATLRDDQREGVAALLTPSQKAVRLTASLEAGGDKAGIELAVDVCKPVVTGLRAISAAADDYAKQAAAAMNGKLTKPAWTAWKRKYKVEAAADDVEKTLARKEVAYYFPGAASIDPVVAKVREAIGTLDGESDAKGDPTGATRRTVESSALPGDAEVSRLLRGLHLDAYTLFANAASEILMEYTPPFTPERLARAKTKVDAYVKAWPVFKALPWKTSFPPQFELAEDVYKDMKLLPSAKVWSSDGKGDAPKPVDAGAGGGKSKGAETVDVVIKRIRDTHTTFTHWLDTEKQKKP